MIVKFLDEEFQCEKAIKSGDSATLYLTEGSTVRFDGVHDWTAFELSGGDWSMPYVTEQEQLRADVDFLAAMTGVSL